MGVVIRRWVWLESINVVSGCFLHITYIFLLHLYLFFFAAASRPPHIILFPLPIILFSNSQNDPLLFLYNSFLCESAHYSFFPAHVGNRGGAKAVQEG